MVMDARFMFHEYVPNCTINIHNRQSQRKNLVLIIFTFSFKSDRAYICTQMNRACEAAAASLNLFPRLKLILIEDIFAHFGQAIRGKLIIGSFPRTIDYLLYSHM